jgi:hypothetical protein
LANGAHSCGSEPATVYILPDKSGVPAETMRLDLLQYQGAPAAGNVSSFTFPHSACSTGQSG